MHGRLPTGCTEQTTTGRRRALGIATGLIRLPRLAAMTQEPERALRSQPSLPDSRLCPLSVIISTHQPWPSIRSCLDALHGEARAAGAEIILADSSGRGLPEDGDRLYPGIAWLKAPDLSSFRLRALALERARGEIIAVTEDHCRVRPGWCKRIITAHRNNPSAAAIGGAVENGSPNHLVDWAGFFIANGPFMLPLRNGESDRIALQANVSYKRRAIAPHIPLRLGFMEMLHNRMLRERGEKLVADDRIVVDHDQCLGFLTFCALHFHNGRCIAGFRLARMRTAERFLRLAGSFILPPVMLWRTLSAVIEKRRFVNRALLALPLIGCLLSCHAAGELVGYLTGPGDSGSYRHMG